MSFEIRKIVSYIEETFIEGGKASDKPVTMVGLAVVMKNPWVGNGFVEDLKPQIRANCSDLGAMMVERLVGLIGGAEKIEAYGKAAVVGADGEIEHASAVIHTLRFRQPLPRSRESQELPELHQQARRPGHLDPDPDDAQGR